MTSIVISLLVVFSAKQHTSIEWQRRAKASKTDDLASLLYCSVCAFLLAYVSKMCMSAALHYMLCVLC